MRVCLAVDGTSALFRGEPPFRRLLNKRCITFPKMNRITLMAVDDRSVRFSCPQCLAGLKAKPALAGTRQRCPRCQHVLEVPRQTRDARRGEPYALRQDGEMSPASEATSVLVVCAVCHTRMHGELEQVGQTLVCPDCGTPAVVPPPASRAASRVTPIPVEEYPLLEDTPGASSDHPIAAETLIRINCPLCRTMMYAGEDQVGQTTICPDCSTPVVVPRPPPPRRKPDPMAEAGEGYGVAAPGEIAASGPVARPVAAGRLADEAGDATDGEPAAVSRGRRSVPPRRPFLVGTFTFPFSSGAWGHTLVLAFWAAVSLGLARTSIQLVASASFATWFGSAILIVVAGLLAVMWFVLASACALVVVRDTANGCDEIQEWPDIGFLDWMGDSLYVFASLSTSLLPGAGLAWLLAGVDQSGRAAILLASLLLVFPIVLLSTLENESPWGIISLPVCRALWTAGRGWIGFYFTSAALLTAVGAVTVGAGAVGGVLGIVGAMLVLAPGWLVYFRLLGRLAWYCADRMNYAESEGEPDAGNRPD